MKNEKFEPDHFLNNHTESEELYNLKNQVRPEPPVDEDASYLVYTIDAFAKSGVLKTGKTVKTGNPAGFMDLRSLATPLTEDVMKAIAKEVGFSETAFVFRSKSADFNVRFFTPSEEVDLCGHATIGLFSGLFQLGLVEAGTYTQKTKAGILEVQIKEDGSVLMEQANPILGETYVDEAIAYSLGLGKEDLHENLPIQAVSTGLLDLLIPVKSREVLGKIKADEDAITEISKKFGVVGYHVFALGDAAEGVQKGQCRNFAPLYAIPEEAATGTSNGALAAYLIHHKASGEEVKRFKFKQGVEMNCPSEIEAYMDEKGKVWVGGSAANLSKRVVNI